MMSRRAGPEGDAKEAADLLLLEKGLSTSVANLELSQKLLEALSSLKENIKRYKYIYNIYII